MCATTGSLRQFTAGILICCLNFLYGIVASWTSPAHDLLKSKLSPVGPLTDSQISWVGSLPPLGAIFGAFFWNGIISKYGRKKTAVINAVPYFTSNLITCVCTNYWILLFARFLAGIGIVGCMINNSNYLSEISEERYKGNICTLLILFSTLGGLFVIAEGSLVPYFYVNLTSTIASGLLFSLLFLIPESPVHLLKKGYDEKARETLKWLRSIQDEVIINRELETLKQCFLHTSQPTRKLSTKEVLANTYYRKVFIIVLTLQSGISLSGTSVLGTYTHDIAERLLGDTYRENYVILFPMSQIFGSIIFFFVCQMFNRKVCHVTCYAGCSLSLMLLGLLLLARTYYGVNVSGYLLISLLCCYFFCQGFGISILFHVLLPEILSAECRNSYTSILMFLHFFLHFLTTKLYPILIEQVRLYSLTFLFGSYSAFVAIFCIMYLPESKSRSIQDIVNKLCRNTESPTQVK